MDAGLSFSARNWRQSKTQIQSSLEVSTIELVVVIDRRYRYQVPPYWIYWISSYDVSVEVGPGRRSKERRVVDLWSFSWLFPCHASCMWCRYEISENPTVAYVHQVSMHHAPCWTANFQQMLTSPPSWRNPTRVGVQLNLQMPELRMMSKDWLSQSEIESKKHSQCSVHSQILRSEFWLFIFELSCFSFWKELRAACSRWI